MTKPPEPPTPERIWRRLRIVVFAPFITIVVAVLGGFIGAVDELQNLWEQIADDWHGRADL